MNQILEGEVESSHSNPWVFNPSNFLSPPKFRKEDTVLKRVNVTDGDNKIVFKESDLCEVEHSWGFCLLGFYGGQFPGKEATENAVAKWPRQAKVAFHPKGWIIFRFANEEDREMMQNLGTQFVFGIPLILCTLPLDFQFDSSHDFKF